MLITLSCKQIKKNAIFASLLRDSRFGERRVDSAWTLTEPICNLLILRVPFTLIRGRTVAGVNVPGLVLVGLAPFLLFRNTALRLMNSPKEKRSLFAYKQIKPLDTFIARALVELSISATVYSISVRHFDQVSNRVDVDHAAGSVFGQQQQPGDTLNALIANNAREGSVVFAPLSSGYTQLKTRFYDEGMVSLPYVSRQLVYGMTLKQMKT